MSTRETPPELEQWIEERAALLLSTARRIVASADSREGQPVGEWLMPLLEEFSHVEQIGKRAVHLLAAYALRHGVTTQTEVARAMGLTVTAAANRAASRVARETWAEVWPEQR
ncbi:hypothetical protein IU443_29835 [Nocardia farcinica]|uniref:hypothetical protein n=1 Tax=Nocardia farcinica TaxID=37329 RepID=UPI0018930595|nr:hypothetical protein [Nocardia farcinica]MBF6394133.1 hypothetical protein [Nocardia farcinica]